MRKAIAAFLALFALLACALGGCSENKEYVLTEKTFFLVMTNMQYYPEQYVGKSVEYDCFTYDLTDVGGKTYRCGVRQCSSGFGCKCGKDTIIGFILNFDGEIPAPKNQSDNSNDKAWVHIKGTIPSSEKTEIRIYAYKDGEVDESTVETVVFLSFDVSSIDPIEDYSGLAHYVEK